jgi:cystathionine beta-lyase family protein involved in aluminum resistance
LRDEVKLKEAEAKEEEMEKIKKLKEIKETKEAAAEVAEENKNENESKVMEILEFSCPYGYTSYGRDSLERVYQEKKRKHAELARELKNIRRV